VYVTYTISQSISLYVSRRGWRALPNVAKCLIYYAPAAHMYPDSMQPSAGATDHQAACAIQMHCSTTMLHHALSCAEDVHVHNESASQATPPQYLQHHHRNVADSSRARTTTQYMRDISSSTQSQRRHQRQRKDDARKCRMSCGAPGLQDHNCFNTECGNNWRVRAAAATSRQRHIAAPAQCAQPRVTTS
jgi:hypothetical protein